MFEEVKRSYNFNRIATVLFPCFNVNYIRFSSDTSSTTIQFTKQCCYLGADFIITQKDPPKQV